MPALTVNLIIPLIFLIIGLVLFYLYFRSVAQMRASAGWSGVQGTVIESKVRRSESTDSDGSTSYTYYPEVRYRFSVMGNEHAGERITFGPKSGGSQSSAQKVVARYPAGIQVMVYYQPDKPDNAVLERTVSKSLLIVGVVFILIGVFFYIRWG